MGMMSLSAAVAAVILLVACDSDSVAPSATAAGTYRVSTINGAAPPAVISQSSQRTISLVGATLRIGGDSKFTLDDTLSVAVTGLGTGPQTDHRTGSYVISGSRVTFSPDQPGLLTVTTLDWSDGKLTLTDPSGSVPVTIVFTRS